MNILHNNLIVIAIVCFFLTMGCDSQLDEKSIPQKPVPFVFNPSVNYFEYCKIYSWLIMTIAMPKLKKC